MIQLLSVPTSSTAQPIGAKEESAEVLEHNFEAEFDALEIELISVEKTLAEPAQSSAGDNHGESGAVDGAGIDIENELEDVFGEPLVAGAPIDERPARTELLPGQSGETGESIQIDDGQHLESYEARMEQALKERGAISTNGSRDLLSADVPNLAGVPASQVVAREQSGDTSVGLINSGAEAASAVQVLGMITKAHLDHRVSLGEHAAQRQRLDFSEETGVVNDPEPPALETNRTLKPAVSMPETGGSRAGTLPVDMQVLSQENGPTESYQKLVGADSNTLVRVFNVEAARPTHSGPVLPAAQSSTLARDAVHLLKVDGGNEIEIQLMPEELGRLKFRMVPGDGQLVIHVSAERPDTLDSLRRNIGALSQDLRDAGFDNASFEFGDSGFERRETETQDYEPVVDADGDTSDQLVGALPQHVLESPSDRLNIKL